MRSKSRSPFWNRLSPQKFTGDTSLALVFVPSVTVLVPAGTQNPSAYSHSWPLAKLLLGQAIGPVVPSVLAPVLAVRVQVDEVELRLTTWCADSLAHQAR